MYRITALTPSCKVICEIKTDSQTTAHDIAEEKLRKVFKKFEIVKEEKIK